MRIFLGHFLPPHIASKAGISVAASNFSYDIATSGIFDMSYSILPNIANKNIDIQKFREERLHIFNSKIRGLPYPFCKLAPIVEQLALFARIPRGSNLWVYNITLLNRLLLAMLRVFKPSVGIYPIVLDYTPGTPSADKELKIINQSPGRISLSNYPEISKVNFKCMPGITPEDCTHPELATPDCRFLLSGVLLEQISSLSKVIKAFKSLPSATLFLTGDISIRKDLTEELAKTPNIKVLGNLNRDEFLRVLNDVTFILSTRDSSYPENLCNFPSKIIEGLLHNRVIVSTIEYPQLADIKYFKIGEDVASMTNDLGHIMSLPPTEIKEYANQSQRTKTLFSTSVWREEMGIIERPYDYVYLTNTPSFYKLQLCRQIVSSGKKVLLVFYGYDSAAVNIKLERSGGNIDGVDYVFINNGDADKRNAFKMFFKIRKLLRHLRYHKLLYSGWMAPEYNLLSLFTPRHNNILICESSVFDTDFSGFKGLIKRLIVSRMGAVLPSGKPHAELFKNIGFKGKCNVTGSVGIFNKGPREFKLKSANKPLKYLYVGRLVDVKNVELLIDVFNSNGQSLTIVGDGLLADTLKSKAKSNIKFRGFIANELLENLYQEHDVFILPSKYEPWGLVVEEALYWGLPVIVSDRVGSSIDMVKDLGTGLIFKSGDKNDLQTCVDKMEREHDKFLGNVKAIDWIEKDKRQVEAYLDLIEG